MWENTDVQNLEMIESGFLQSEFRMYESMNDEAVDEFANCCSFTRCTEDLVGARRMLLTNSRNRKILEPPSLSWHLPMLSPSWLSLFSSSRGNATDAWWVSPSHYSNRRPYLVIKSNTKTCWKKMLVPQNCKACENHDPREPQKGWSITKKKTW